MLKSVISSDKNSQEMLIMAGRAIELQSVGREFEPLLGHHIINNLENNWAKGLTELGFWWHLCGKDYGAT